MHPDIAALLLITLIALPCLLALSVPALAAAVLRADLHAASRVAVFMTVLVVLIAAAGVLVTLDGGVGSL